MKKFGLIGLALWIILSGITPAASDEQVDGQRIRDYIKILADDGMTGRRSGLPGYDKAAEYIADKFREWNISPAGENGSYFQKFMLEAYFTVEPGCSLEIVNIGDRRTFRFNQEYYDEWRVCDMSGSGDMAAEIVFVGYGIHDPENGYDDYKNVEIKGKVAFICSGYPENLATQHAKAMAYEARIQAARNLGAAAVMLFPEPQPFGKENHWPAMIRLTPESYQPDFVVVGVNSLVADYIFNYLGTRLSYETDTIKEKIKPRSFNTGVKACLSVRTELVPQKETFNVLGKLEGTDTHLKEEFVILGAHLDGLGMTPMGEVLNGANDNASGTAVVMETARFLKSSEFQPRRTLVFALWAAEEQGLLGSTHYASNPLFPLEKTVANINLDMVGQGGDKIDLGGIYLSSEIWEMLKPRMNDDVMSGIHPRRGVGGSDHLSFLAQGVPAFHMVGNRPHFKGHQSRDDLDLIKIDMLEKAARFLLEATRVLASEEGDFFFPHRAEKILFRRENIVNTHPVSVESLIQSHKDDVNPDIDLQLAYVHPGSEADLCKRKLQLLDNLSGLGESLKGSSGLSLFSGDYRRFLRSRGTQLLIGLDGAGELTSDQAWLRILASNGLHFVKVDQSDLIFEDGDLTKKGKSLIQGASAAKILPIISGLDDSLAKKVLENTRIPILLIRDKVPTEELAQAILSGNHLLGLLYSQEESSESYFSKLKQARQLLSENNLMIWMEQCLRSEQGQVQYLDLFRKFLEAKWTTEGQIYQTTLNKIISLNFSRLMMHYSTPR